MHRVPSSFLWARPFACRTEFVRRRSEVDPPHPHHTPATPHPHNNKEQHTWDGRNPCRSPRSRSPRSRSPSSRTRTHAMELQNSAEARRLGRRSVVLCSRATAIPDVLSLRAGPPLQVRMRPVPHQAVHCVAEERVQRDVLPVRARREGNASPLDPSLRAGDQGERQDHSARMRPDRARVSGLSRSRERGEQCACHALAVGLWRL